MKKNFVSIVVLAIAAVAIAWSLSGCSRLAGDINAPSNLTITYNSNSDTVSATWTDNSDNEKGFYIYWSSSAACPISPNETLDADTASLDIPASDVGYNEKIYFWLKAYNRTTTSPTITKSTVIYKDYATLVFSDEFDGSAIDATKWGYDVGNGCEIGLCGWGNGELEYYTEGANATVSGGMLTITAKNESYSGYNYTSVRMKTKNKFDFTYGKVIIRAKLPYGQGIWPAFWMLPTDEVYGGWPNSGEIDIMESIGNNPNKIYGTAHTYNNNGENGRGGNLTVSDVVNNWHEYCVIWAPTYIKWYIDDILYATVEKGIGDTYKDWPFDQKFHIIMNIAVGGAWPGSPDGTTVFPQKMYVDYVRVYQ